MPGRCRAGCAFAGTDLERGASCRARRWCVSTHRRWRRPLARAARRHDAGGAARRRQRLDAARRQQPGHLGADRRPGRRFSMLPGAAGRRHRHAAAGDSRTGENLFWLGRYTERTETAGAAGARDAEPDRRRQGCRRTRAACALGVAVRNGLAPPGMPTPVQSPSVFERALLGGAGRHRGAPQRRLQPRGPGARPAGAARAAVAASNGALCADGRTSPRRPQAAPRRNADAAQVLPALDRLAVQLAAVTGAQTDRMTHDHGWRLLTVGRLIERLIGLTPRCSGRRAGAWAAPPASTCCWSCSTARSHPRPLPAPRGLLALTDLLVQDKPTRAPTPGAAAAAHRAAQAAGWRRRHRRPLLALLPADGAGLFAGRPAGRQRGADRRQAAGLISPLQLRASRAGMQRPMPIGERYHASAHRRTPHPASDGYDPHAARSQRTPRATAMPHR